MDKKANNIDSMYRFLVQSVFGYDISVPNDEGLKKACLGRAYLDLARVIPYKYSTSKINDKGNSLKEKEDILFFKEKKEAFKTVAKSIILKNGSFPSFKIKELYQKAETSEFKDSVFSEKYKFTYGMAQKWVNMYEKYMWLFNKNNHENFDMPIDSYIIDALFSNSEFLEEWRNSKVAVIKGIIDESDKCKKRYKECVPPWSQWNEELYIEVQDIIKRIYSNYSNHILQWENDMWIEQAILRNNK